MSLMESGEMYLEAIHVLSKTSTAVRRVDISEYLGYSKPSVTRAINVLEKDGFVATDPNGHVSLTLQGLEVAETIYERHVILTRLLQNLGVSKEVAEEDACRVEHYISEETFEAIKHHMSQYEAH